MKFVTSILLLTAFFTVVSCNNSEKTSKGNSDTLVKRNGVYPYESKDVSLIALIANPKQFNGHKVRVIGYLNLEFEGNGIYVNKEDYDESINKNALWVEISRDSLKIQSVKQCIKHYVLIEGTFNSDRQGHMNMYSGSITNVTRLEQWQEI